MFANTQCFCEASVANLSKDYSMVLDLGAMHRWTRYAPPLLAALGCPCVPAGLGYLNIIEECAMHAGRAPPLTPAAFYARLQSKSFTSKKADLPTVRCLYDDAFAARLGGARTLAFGGLNWGDDEAAQFAELMRSGVLTRVESIALTKNRIGEAGMRALAEAIASGGLPACCTDLRAFGNLASDEPVQQAFQAHRTAALHNTHHEAAV